MNNLNTNIFSDKVTLAKILKRRYQLTIKLIIKFAKLYFTFQNN